MVDSNAPPIASPELMETQPQPSQLGSAGTLPNWPLVRAFLVARCYDVRQADG